MLIYLIQAFQALGETSDAVSSLNYPLLFSKMLQHKD